MTETKPTLVLVSGYARAGKDTFADGMLDTAPEDIMKLSFATALKDGADEYLATIGINDSDSPEYFSFHNQDFKNKHRDMLVSLGRFARNLDPNVFVRSLCSKAMICHSIDLTSGIVVPDCRYANEVTHARELLPEWRIVTVRINTTGAGPANEEEERSIFLLDREVVPDYVYSFGANSVDSVLTAGRDLARELSL